MKQAQDWGAPPKGFAGDMPAASRSSDEWKVLEDRRANFGGDAFCIYAVPPVVQGMRNAPARLVAKCEKQSDADLIVALYEAHRKVGA